MTDYNFIIYATAVDGYLPPIEFRLTAAFERPPYEPREGPELLAELLESLVRAFGGTVEEVAIFSPGSFSPDAPTVIDLPMDFPTVERMGGTIKREARVTLPTRSDYGIST